MIQEITCDLFKPHEARISHGFLTRHGNSPKNIFSVKQVHGNQVCHLDTLEKLTVKPESDIIVTHLLEIPLTIKTADCVPLLFFDPHTSVIATAHAGWRGTAAGVARKTVETLIQHYRSNPSHLLVAMGPAIDPCCYEVDQKVYDGIAEKEAFFKTKPGHWKVNLKKANQLQLIAIGVNPKNIWISDLCTCCREELFFSYRREGDKAGRQRSYIALRKQ